MWIFLTQVKTVYLLCKQHRTCQYESYRGIAKANPNHFFILLKSKQAKTDFCFFTDSPTEFGVSGFNFTFHGK